jgi:hypothetical protein
MGVSFSFLSNSFLTTSANQQSLSISMEAKAGCRANFYATQCLYHVNVYSLNYARPPAGVRKIGYSLSAQNLALFKISTEKALLKN